MNSAFSCKNINFNNDMLKGFMKNYGFIYLN